MVTDSSRINKMNTWQLVEVKIKTCFRILNVSAFGSPLTYENRSKHLLPCLNEQADAFI